MSDLEYSNLEESTASKQATTSSRIGTAMGFPIGFGIKMVLEVLGASGAVWGSSEVFGLRDNENNEMWKQIAVTVGIIAFVRQGSVAYYSNPEPNNTPTTFLGGFFSAVSDPYKTFWSQVTRESQETDLPTLYETIQYR